MFCNTCDKELTEKNLKFKKINIKNCQIKTWTYYAVCPYCNNSIFTDKRWYER